MLPLTRLRSSDLINTEASALAHGERMIAYARLRAEAILPTTWGLLINQAQARRKWHPDPTTTERCHLVLKEA